MLLTVIESDGGPISAPTAETLTIARRLADVSGMDLEVVAPAVAAPAAQDLAGYGVDRVRLVEHDALADATPEAWGVAVAQVIEKLRPAAVVGPGTEPGNEVLAQAAARTGLPLAANCIEVTAGDGPWTLTRLRHGGVLLEDAELDADVKLVTVAPGAVEVAPAGGAADPAIEHLTVDLDGRFGLRLVEPVTHGDEVTLATAPVVVSGGRGMGSAEGFAAAEELAELLGGAVGCSRVATNNGWRPHADQVGQTGTTVAPTLYIAAGISGATQHWVGCMNAKTILAINSDADAPMVTRANYAVVGDLHKILPAIVAEVRKRADTSRT